MEIDIATAEGNCIIAIVTGQRKVSLKDVAQKAGVSTATVSRVARGQLNVDPAIRVKVLKAAAGLGVDIEEKHKKNSSVVAFILGNRDVLHSFQARILLGAEQYCTSQHLDLLFMSLRYSPTTPAGELHLPQILGRRSVVRSVILGGTNSANLIQALREREISFSVLANNVVGPWDPLSSDCVYSDDIQGAFDLTSQFIASGHRDIWFIGDVDLPWYSRCAEGYTQAMDQAGLLPRYSQIHSDDQQLGYLAMRSILSRQEPVSAVFAGSDQIARGVYEALRQSGVAIPEDVSVAGFNDSEAALMYPTLTSVREYPEELGKHLAEFVVKRMKEPERPYQQLTIPTKVILRDSTRALVRGRDVPGPVTIGIPPVPKL